MLLSLAPGKHEASYPKCSLLLLRVCKSALTAASCGQRERARASLVKDLATPASNDVRAEKARRDKLLAIQLPQEKIAKTLHDIAESNMAAIGVKEARAMYL